MILVDPDLLFYKVSIIYDNVLFGVTGSFTNTHIPTLTLYSNAPVQYLIALFMTYMHHCSAIMALMD